MANGSTAILFARWSRPENRNDRSYGPNIVTNPLDEWAHYWHLVHVATVDEILEQMRSNPKDVRFADLCKVLDHYFGSYRQSGTSHRIYKTPWPMDPRVNIQEDKGGKAKAYQARQCVLAIDTLAKIQAKAATDKKEEVK